MPVLLSVRKQVFAKHVNKSNSLNVNIWLNNLKRKICQKYLIKNYWKRVFILVTYVENGIQKCYHTSSQNVKVYT